MCTRRQCTICRARIPTSLYRSWGIDDLEPDSDCTVDLVTRVALGQEEDRTYQMVRDVMTEFGYTGTDIAAVGAPQTGTATSAATSTVRDRIPARTRAQWDTMIQESVQRHTLQTIPPDTDFVDPILEEAVRGAEADTREMFSARVYADHRIWEMGHDARCTTAADQELAYARVRFLDRQRAPPRGDSGAGGAESSRAAEDRFIDAETRAAEHTFGDAFQDPAVPSQRTIAERVIQVPRTRTQRGSYYEVDSDSD